MRLNPSTQIVHGLLIPVTCPTWYWVAHWFWGSLWSPKPYVNWSHSCFGGGCMLVVSQEGHSAYKRSWVGRCIQGCSCSTSMESKNVALLNWLCMCSWMDIWHSHQNTHKGLFCTASISKCGLDKIRSVHCKSGHPGIKRTLHFAQQIHPSSVQGGC